MATPHISAEKNQIAKLVVMAGDPLRAKLFADEYLDSYELVSDVRGMYVFTGYTLGKKVTVMGHGMGLDSIGIYAYELYDYYDVDTIIRFGSAGSYSKDIGILDFIIAKEAFTESNFGIAYGYYEDTISANSELVELAERIARDVIVDRPVIVGKINSSS
jgi:purine-nucleoside phosphorylase